MAGGRRTGLTGPGQARGAFPPAGRWAGAAACAAVLTLAGCTGTPTASEATARSDLAQVTQRYRPGDARPVLPALTPASPLADFLRFALLRSPRVEAAYYEWAAAVERIAPARSLPDPRLTFQADISRTVMALMPGLMIDLPGPGKLQAAGDTMAAESRIYYFNFERELLAVALAVKTAYHRRHFLEQTIGLQQETRALLIDLDRLAEQQNAAGKATLLDVLRARIARDQVDTQIAHLQDARGTLAAEFKAALGLGPRDPDPPLPMAFEASTEIPAPDALLATALARNPMLRAMESDVLRAAAALELARTAGVPDFALGLEADVRASPLMVRPSAGMSLPLWRDKVAAGIAAAQAVKQAAEARLSAEEVRLAAELASLLYLYREAVREEALVTDKLRPKARQALAAARAGYATGRTGFLDVIDAQRALLMFELTGVAARTQRELALASLSLAIAGVPPAEAPVLPAATGPAIDPPRTIPTTSAPQEVRP